MAVGTAAGAVGALPTCPFLLSLKAAFCDT